MIRYANQFLGVIIWLFCAAGLGNSSLAEELISALSSNEVSITSNFTGTKILVFGEINRDATAVSRAGGYDLVVVVEGPPERVTTWRKERILGVWINSNSRVYPNVPSFYAVHSSAPLEEVSWEITLRQLRTGLSHLPVSPPGLHFASSEDRIAFEDAFIRKRVEDGLYSERSDAIEFLSPSLFATTIPLPANISTGTFSITTYLYSGEVLLASQRKKLVVKKTGFEQYTYSLAQKHSAVYGIIAVLLALSTGWLAGVIFRRN
ncbi:TIGR02186 family protein [Flexibacterium corallicola]|uniref:TIGR02186 family protein n=1 Tax=Flexibacterium corallicola TaxID=3037259 RepID=UPI00286F50C6|nr:TIGR02186 family protein [Pseudovibrio sp. M1P-2-3]